MRRGNVRKRQIMNLDCVQSPLCGWVRLFFFCSQYSSFSVGVLYFVFTVKLWQIGSLNCMQTLITVLPLFCNSPTSALNPSHPSGTSQSVKDSVVSQLYLTDRSCFLWGRLNLSLSAFVSLTLIASELISLICTLMPVALSCCASELKIFCLCACVYVCMHVCFSFTIDSDCVIHCNLSKSFERNLAST